MKREYYTNIHDKLSRWVVDPGTGCYIWYGAYFRGGYGNVHIYDVNMGAHIAMYLTYVGPIPEGYDLDHLCREPRCVRPAHLEPVTRQENLRRGLGNRFTRERRLAAMAVGRP